VLEARIAARTGDASDATVAVLHRAARAGAQPLDWRTVDAADAGRALREVRDALQIVSC
jgi:predicted kinase